MTRRQRIAIGGIVGAALMGLGTGLISAPAGAGPQVTSTAAGVNRASTAHGGFLDRTFAGKGYRLIPTSPSVTGGMGQAVLITDTGRLRTLVRNRLSSVAPNDFDHTSVLTARGWTMDGWTDSSFYGGGTKTSHVFGDSDLVSAGATGQGTISLATTGWGSLAISAARYGPDGRTVASTVLAKPPDGEGGDEYYTKDATGLLPTGEMVVVRFPSGASSYLAFYDAHFNKVRETRVSHWVTGFAMAGTHMWAIGYGYASRMSLDGVPDTGWGGDGTVDGVARFAGHVSGAGYGISGRSALTVRRFTPSGDLDPAFGNAGSVDVGGSGSLLTGRTASVHAWRATAKGLLLSLQLRDVGTDQPWRYRLIRLGLNGALDPTFGSDGIARSTKPITAITHDSHGRIYTLTSNVAGPVNLARRIG